MTTLWGRSIRARPLCWLRKTAANFGLSKRFYLSHVTRLVAMATGCTMAGAQSTPVRQPASAYAGLGHKQCVPQSILWAFKPAGDRLELRASHRFLFGHTFLLFIWANKMSTNSDIQLPETTTDLYGALGRDLMDCDPPCSDFSEALLDFEEQLYDRLCHLPAAADRALAKNLDDTSAGMPDYYAQFFQEVEPCGHDGQGTSQAFQNVPSSTSSSGTTSSTTGSARRETHGGGRSASRVRQFRTRGESSSASEDVTTSSEDNDSSDDEYVPVKKTVKRGIAVNAGQAPKRPVLVDDTNTPRPSSAQVIYVPGSDSDE